MRSLVARLTRRYSYTGRRYGTQQPKVWQPPHVAWPPPADPWRETAETVVIPRIRPEVNR